MKNILGIIPARGGSKGILRKNLYPLAGQPLIWYTFQAVRASMVLTRTILTTEDQEIAQYAMQQGIEVPFMRPLELAQDETPSLAVIQHALHALAKDFVPDVIVLLQPTAPLRQGCHIDEAVRLLLQQNAEAVVSVSPIPAHYHPYWAFAPNEAHIMQPFDERGGPQAASAPPAFTAGVLQKWSVRVARRQLIQEQHTLYGLHPFAYTMSPDVSVNIDSIEMTSAAEYYHASEKMMTPFLKIHSGSRRDICPHAIPIAQESGANDATARAGWRNASTLSRCH